LSNVKYRLHLPKCADLNVFERFNHFSKRVALLKCRLLNIIRHSHALACSMNYLYRNLVLGHKVHYLELHEEVNFIKASVEEIEEHSAAILTNKRLE